MSRVLVVDDDPHLRRTLRINLTAHGHTSWRICCWVTSIPGWRTRCSSTPHSVGLRCTSAPSRTTFLATRSTVKLAVSTTGVPSGATAAARRTAARSRASSSGTPKGLVM